MKVRRKVVLEAEQLTRDRIEAHLLMGEALPPGVVTAEEGDPNSLSGAVIRFGVHTKTLGFIHLEVNDWVISSPDGSVHPCPNEAFEEMYEPVEKNHE